MLQRMRWMMVVVILGLAASMSTGADKDSEGWSQLFNGKDLTGWDTWSGRVVGADPQINLVKDYLLLAQLPEDKRTQLRKELDELAKSLKDPVGLNRDPTRVYTVVEADGKPAIRVSGQVFGALTSKEEFENYHLRLEFKWGQKKWPPRETVVRDSGLLYHCVGPHGAGGSFWMQSLECQIQERDCGDYWSVAGAIVDVEGERKDGKGPIVYKKGGGKFTVPTKETGSRIVKGADFEKPTGQWNTIEVLTVGGTSVHVINGKVNMVLTGSRRKVGDKEEPLTRGKIQLQSEGAEVFYRNVAVKPLKRIPEEYLK